MTTIQQNPFSDLLKNTMQSFLKEKIETLLKEEIKNYFSVERPEEANSRNGYYSRTWETRHGVIPDLQVPRDRKNHYQTELFEPYQRREAWLCNAPHCQDTIFEKISYASSLNFRV
jgi:transposase-like protein